MLKKYKAYFALFLIVVGSPVLGTLLARIGLASAQWLTADTAIPAKVNLFFSERAIEPVYFLRHAQTDAGGVVFIISKLLYNRILVFISEFLAFMSFFSPRFFFQAGDGTVFSPNTVEPIAFMLLPFWLYGLLLSINKRKWWILAGYVFSTFVAYLFGKREFPFLIFTLLFQFYFIYVGILALIHFKRTRLYLGLAIIYSIFVVGRLFVV